MKDQLRKQYIDGQKKKAMEYREWKRGQDELERQRADEEYRKWRMQDALKREYYEEQKKKIGPAAQSAVRASRLIECVFSWFFMFESDGKVEA